MKNRAGILIISSLILGVSIGSGYGTPTLQEEQQTEKQEEKQEQGKEQEEAAPDEFPPVDNMHHMMEYIFQPTYKNMKAALAEDPGAPAEWKKVKGYALILAETTALLADRPPRDATEEQIKEWRKISWDVRNAGRVLYRSMRNYPQARKNYELMIDNCNKCHQIFVDGRYQLEK